MVELQSCGSLVNASALCAIEHEVKRESVNLVAEISAELHREKQKNAELMERVSILEAQLGERDKDPLHSNGQVNCQNTMENNSKRQKVATNAENFGEEDTRVDLQTKDNNISMSDKDMFMKNRMANWMGMDGTECLYSEILKESESAADFEDTEDSDEDDINGFSTDNKDSENDKEVTRAKEVKENLFKQEVVGKADAKNVVSCSSGHGEPTSVPVVEEIHEYLIEKSFNPGINPHDNLEKRKHHESKEITMTAGHQEASQTYTPGQEIKECENIILQKKPRKIAFCPKEVKRIVESEELLLKNAQSHTIRKLIVFASLGIRHGCEDMYELDFNHFSILQKGEPFLSPKDPGEYVIYENPGVQRKIFYPNRQNPNLCPVQILEEEEAMRPSDASCPSCLFLCIKYGGRTRNIPQNEYVRQRMGRNKLKSFGPAICQMAKLVHIRSGSFFFKALGITLLFMAGFPDDLVQSETKYKNLDLLQKYYRTDEDADGEELFLPHRVTYDKNAALNSSPLTMKTISTKLKCKRQTDSARKGNHEETSTMQPAPSDSGTSSQFESVGYASIQNQAITAAPPMTPQAPADLFSVANPLINHMNPNFPQYDQSSYPMFPPHTGGSFVPTTYWHPCSTFLPVPHPSSHIFRYPIAGNYISVYPKPYYSSPLYNTLIPKPLKESWKNDVASKNAASDSNSSPSSTKPKTIRQADK